MRYDVDTDSRNNLAEPFFAVQRCEGWVDGDVNAVERPEIEQVFQFIQGALFVSNPHFPGGAIIPPLVERRPGGCLTEKGLNEAVNSVDLVRIQPAALDLKARIWGISHERGFQFGP